METYAVKMEQITKIFGGVKANDSVDFALRPGSIHGLLGENGAGKTTLMNVLYGLYQQESGRVIINGNVADITSPTHAISLGIGMVHQHFMLARPFTIVENVMLGKKSRRGILLDTKETAKELKELSEKYRMQIDPYAKISQLSVGEQQRVEILTALYMGAQILILDEPTAVLTPQETEVFFETLREMRDDGKSIVLITHKLEEIVSIVDEVSVLRDGKMIGSNRVDEHVTKDDLIRMMVGRDVLFHFPDLKEQSGEEIYNIQDLVVSNDKGLPALHNLSLSLKAGEIVGLAGVDGNGQRELCEALTGLRTITSGTLTLENRNMTHCAPMDFIQNGVSYIPEDRHTTGLAMNWDLKKNLILKCLHKAPFARYGLMQKKAIDQHWEKLQADYQIKANSGEDTARNLSGGNQQKVILAREISSVPKVLIASQPTRGLDIGAAEYVRGQMIDARNNGAAVLVISADLEELGQLSDRIAVIYDGRITGILPRGADNYTIGELMMGKQKEVANHGT